MKGRPDKKKTLSRGGESSQCRPVESRYNVSQGTATKKKDHSYSEGNSIISTVIQSCVSLSISLNIYIVQKYPKLQPKNAHSFNVSLATINIHIIHASRSRFNSILTTFKLQPGNKLIIST